MSPPPIGTVTFLFTDIEGSTKLWQQNPDAMKIALERHHALLQHAIEANRGYVFQIVGDGFCAAFQTASDGVAAALAAQRAIVGESWNEVGPIRVRMALHTGPADTHAGEYKSGEYVSGLTLSRTARLLSAAHGSQILVSQVTEELVRDQLPPRVELRDLGNRRLKGFARSEQVFLLAAPDLASNLPATSALDVIPNNLPVQLTKFVGREREMFILKGLLGTTRLLTVTGTGGSGKTRLVLEVAACLASGFDDGIWLIELAGLVDPALVPQAAAAVLKVREEPGRTLIEAIVDCIRTKRMLLVFDNCEHLIPACAALIDSLLRSLPNLTVLATSREALGMAGETTWVVPSLSVPERRRQPRAAEVLRHDAVRLFVERAAAVVPGFTVTDANAATVATVCRRLDGIPLAIELAAARLNSLTIEQIAARLDERLRLLTRGNRTALPRHQTLRAALDWSYELLEASEQALFRRLSVFAGGFTIDAAQTVGAGDAVNPNEVPDLVSQLVGKSLVLMNREGAAHYQVLETLREYGAHKLHDAGEVGHVRARHRDWMLELMTRAEPELRGTNAGAWLDRLDAEHDNLRAALERGNPEADGEARLRLATASWRFWDVQGYLSEGRAWLEDALRRAGSASASLRAGALVAAGNLAYRQGDHQQAACRWEEGLALWRELGDRRRVASVLNNLGLLQQSQGDGAAAMALCEESLALKRELGDRREVAETLNNLVGIAWELGDHERAIALCEESLGLSRELGDRRGTAMALGNFGLLAYHRGDYAVARGRYEESLAIDRELGNRIGIANTLWHLGCVAQSLKEHARAAALYQDALALCFEAERNIDTAMCLESLASVACAQCDHRRGVRLFGAAAALRTRIGIPVRPADGGDINRDTTTARTSLGVETFAKLWEAGGSMTLEQAVEYATGPD